MTKLIADLGLDLTRHVPVGLVRAALWHTSAALAECLPLAGLWWLVPVWQSRPPALSDIALLTTALLLLFTLQVICRAQANRATYSSLYWQAARSRLMLADRIAQWPMGRLDQHGSAQVTDILTTRYAQLQDILANVWGGLLANFATPLLLILWLACIQPALALATLLVAPLALLPIPWACRLLQRANRRLEPQRTRLTEGIDEQLGAQQELQLYDPGKRRLARVVRQLARLERSQLAAELAPAPALLIFQLCLQAGLATLVLMLALQPESGRHGIAMLVLFLVLLRLFRALTEIGLCLLEARHARDTLALIRNLYDEPMQSQPIRPIQPVDHTIHFDQVGFRHAPNAPETLHCIHGLLAAGTTLALVGPSGAGKSTLAGLAARLWDPSHGHIRIGGTDLRQMSSDMLNRTVSVMLQDSILFDGSIADNIRLGRPDASLQEIMDAARQAQAHHFIDSLPEGYDTWVEGLSPRFSGGECQRLAIARALLKNAPILILDEALASQDDENAQLIRTGLRQLMQGKTVILIAHQLEMAREADQIWVMEHGRVVESGTHDTLLAQPGGLYQRLWQAQHVNPAVADPSVPCGSPAPAH